MKTETIEEMCSYRNPMVVKEKLVYLKNMRCSYDREYPICPRCGSIFEIEYQKFCGNCGQRLKWKGYARAKARFVE